MDPSIQRIRIRTMHVDDVVWHFNCALQAKRAMVYALTNNIPFTPGVTDHAEAYHINTADDFAAAYP